ncbi:pannier [Anaeramoeba ignava]|uniref:Pannier n=1 Tax=Anaeramoeba ignava TaxID=1746090 RepID=A0A9Q0LWF3_ANAIG|nr:pannier [Anaeramoeba ignava]
MNINSITCSNPSCRTKKTPLWRKVNDLYYCNACAIYRRRHGRDRPIGVRATNQGRRKRSKTPNEISEEFLNQSQSNVSPSPNQEIQNQPTNQPSNSNISDSENSRNTDQNTDPQQSFSNTQNSPPKINPSKRIDQNFPKNSQESNLKSPPHQNTSPHQLSDPTPSQFMPDPLKRKRLDRSYSLSDYHANRQNPKDSHFPDLFLPIPKYPPRSFRPISPSHLNTQSYFSNNYPTFFPKSKSETNLQRNFNSGNLTALSFLSEIAANYLTDYENNTIQNTMDFQEYIPNPFKSQTTPTFNSTNQQKNNTFETIQNSQKKKNPFNLQKHPQNIETENSSLKPFALDFDSQLTFTQNIRKGIDLQAGDCVGMQAQTGHEIYAIIRKIFWNQNPNHSVCFVKWLIPKDSDRFGLPQNLQLFQADSIGKFEEGYDEPRPQPLACVTRKLPFRYNNSSFGLAY